jgi:hypothetical protein
MDPEERNFAMHRFVTALAALCAPVALATDDYRTTIWVTPTYIATLPVTGLAWDNLECFASKDFDYSDQDAALFPNLSNLNSHADMLALAKALVWKRTGGMSGEYAHYRCEIRDAIMGIPAGPGCCAVVEEEEICNSNSLMGTECWGGDNSVCDNSSEDNVLPTARNLPGWIIAAGLVTLHATDRIIFENWLNGEYGLPTKQIGGSNDTLSLTHDRRPNNHGTCAGAALAAIAYYTDDEDLMAAVASVFHEYTGETPVTASAWGGHGATCWQPENNNPNNYVYGINPPGAQVKIPPVTGTLRDCDGVLPDDQRRCDQGGCPCTTGTPTCTTCIGGSEAENSGALLWDDTTGTRLRLRRTPGNRRPGSDPRQLLRRRHHLDLWRRRDHARLRVA